MTDVLAQLFRHNHWANLKIIDWCESIPAEALDVPSSGTFGSPRATLVHLLAAEEGYLRLIDVPPPDASVRGLDTFPGFDALRRAAEYTGRAFVTAAEAIGPEGVWRGQWGGSEYEVDQAVVMMQVINHATEHREQIKDALSRADYPAPEVDSWAFAHEKNLMRKV